MSQIHVTIKTSDGGTLTLSHDTIGFILGRKSAPKNGDRPKVQTIRLYEDDLRDIPTMIFAIGRLL